LAEGPARWKPCYLHPGKPAIGECVRCARPVCSICAGGSGGARCCPPCASGEGSPAGQAAPDGGASAAGPAGDGPGGGFALSEITVHPDGKVEAPAADEPPAPAREPLAGAGEGKAAEPVAGAPRGPRAAAGAAPRRAEGGDAAGGGRLSGLLPRGGTARQLADAIPVALLAGAVTYAFWLLLALLVRRWVQTSVLTAGIVVPWALFRGTTYRKSYGVPLYTRSPRALYISITSLAVMAALFLVAESLAFAVIYRGTNIADPLSRFLKANTDPLDIIQVALGFVLAAALPFWLKLGERRPPEAPGGD